jgi:16S rRNA (uracil1498-N3)-methyltransferase
VKYGNSSDKHQFALYLYGLSELIHGLSAGQSLVITESNLVHRIAVILRLAAGEQLVLFDRVLHVDVTITQIIKNKSIHVMLGAKKNNTIYAPSITFLLPVLKKESLETALYSLVEMGVTHIQLVLTNKSQQKWTPKEYERAQKILIAAAEQSKNFAFATLEQPLPLNKALATIKKDAAKLFFDPEGEPLSSLVCTSAHRASLVLAIGPEGDLTSPEKEIMRQAGFGFYVLTPTILRACQAAALSAGIIRTLIK